MSATGKAAHELIEECQGLVWSLATKIHRRLPAYLDMEDLVSYGQVGLAEAARDYDPGAGSQFSTFAYYRIRGAIYDGLAKMTWFSRAHYRRMRYEQMANEVLCLEGEPAETQSPGGVEEDARWLTRVAGKLAVVYLALGGDREDENGAVELVDEATPGPAATAISQEAARTLHQLMDALPAESRQLLHAVYFDGCTLQEAGQRLGISKAWASRLHAKTLERLARSLRLLGIGE